MKTLLVKLQFKLASWLYNQGIIAPQLLERPDGTPRRVIKILTPEESQELTDKKNEFVENWVNNKLYNTN